MEERSQEQGLHMGAQQEPAPLSAGKVGVLGCGPLMVPPSVATPSDLSGKAGSPNSFYEIS